MELEAVEADAAIDISKFCQGLRCVGKHQRPLRCQGSLDADDRLSSSTGVNVGVTMSHLVHLVVVGMRVGGALGAVMTTQACKRIASSLRTHRAWERMRS